MNTDKLTSTPDRRAFIGLASGVGEFPGRECGRNHELGDRGASYLKTPVHHHLGGVDRGSVPGNRA